MAALEKRFKSLYPEFSGLAMSQTPDRFVIGSDEQTWVEIWTETGRWTVSTSDGHGHTESAAESMELAAGILRGTVRFCQEFRNETRSATWIEVQVEDYFEARHIALYLSPFDPDEWQLRDDESWRQKRTVRRVTGRSRIEVESWEIEAAESINSNGSTLGYLRNGLGEPESAMKWVTRGQRFIFQCPLGWRRVRGGLGEEDIDDYSPQNEHAIFRAYAWFREGLDPRATAPIAVWPGSIDYLTEGEKDGWHLDKWTLLFSNGAGEMMGNLELYTLPNDQACRDKYVPIINRSARCSIYVSGHADWNCSDVSASRTLRTD